MILPKRILLSSVLGASTMSAGDWNIEADYQAFCANCHGASGAGDGQAAEYGLVDKVLEGKKALPSDDK